MESLFITGPVYDKHVVSIINLMLTRLRNNHPKQDSKCYQNTAVYIQELYDGVFLRHRFDETSFNQFNMQGYQDIIKSCKGDWLKIKQVINKAIDNLELSRSDKYLPLNKKYVENITFATFFEAYSFTSFNGEINCNFIKYINEPKFSYEYFSELRIQKLKSQVSDSIGIPAQIFASKYFKSTRQLSFFWNAMVDWTRWLNQFKKTFPQIYSEFISVCDEGNPFIDFKNFLLRFIEYKQGESGIVEETNFLLSRNNSGELEGSVRSWLNAGMNSSKFSVLKQLPKSITQYYTNESFVKTSQITKLKEEKQVIELEDIPIF